VSLALPPAQDAGTVTDAAKLTLGASVVSLAVPTGENAPVQEMSFKAQGKIPLSCALENAAGVVVHRKSRVSECTLLVRPRNEKFRVRLWTVDGTTQVVTAYRSRPVVEGAKGEAPADKALAVTVPHAGRYRTSAQVFLHRSERIGNAAALRAGGIPGAGATVFSTVGTQPQPLSLEEDVFAASDSAIALSSFACTVRANDGGREGLAVSNRGKRAARRARRADMRLRLKRDRLPRAAIPRALPQAAPALQRPRDSGRRATPMSKRASRAAQSRCPSALKH
jgi:hypothetical protein